MSLSQNNFGTRGNNVVLIGFRCSGKNTVGELLALKLQWPVFDMDQRIQDIAGQSIASLVERSGWKSFRDLESKVVREVKPQEQKVIITGGGVVERPENLSRLRRSGLIVFLEVDIKDVLRRMAEDELTPVTRPGLTGLPWEEEVQLLLEKRKPLYLNAADIIVDTSLHSAESCVDKIIQFLSGRLITS